MTKLVVAKPVLEAERIEPEDDRPAIGSWWWVRSSECVDDEDCDLGRTWLGCVIERGSNFAKLKGIRYSTRVAFDDMAERCEPCPNPDEFIASKINEHKTNVRELMGEIQRVCRQLGVPFNQALAAAIVESIRNDGAMPHGLDVTPMNPHIGRTGGEREQRVRELRKVGR